MEKWEKEVAERNRIVQAETDKINNEILQIPAYLTEEEKLAMKRCLRLLILVL